MSMIAPTDTRRPSGLDLLEAEMARQRADALASIPPNAETAGRIAASAVRNQRLLLVGMGASHYANRIVEPLYRRLGIDALACTAAELMHTPPPASARTTVFVSQSGESGEIVELLKRQASHEDRFGMTLDPSSTLGRALPCLVGAGGAELAFAATRSLVVTLALHASVLAALGVADHGATDSLQHFSPGPPLDDALSALAGKTAIVFAGRGVFRGVAEAASLMLMELARMPALGFEIGQFRHGPLELLSPEIGVVLLCGESDSAAVATLAQAAADAGTRPVILDCSGGKAVGVASTLDFPPRRDLAAVFAVFPALLRLVISIAARKVERVGEPVRSTKITREAS